MVKYYEPKIVENVIGCIVKDPTLLDKPDAQRITEVDFGDPVHKLVFFTVNNLYQDGHRKISGQLIEDYLYSRPNLFKVFNEKDGYSVLNRAVETANEYSFAPNIERIKKFTLLRGLDNAGIDVSYLYNWESKDPVTKQRQEDYLLSAKVPDLANIVSSKIDKVMEESEKAVSEGARAQAGDGVRELKERLKLEPDFGSPLYGKLVNTMLRGARKGKFYLRSCPTGSGKTRMMVADATNFAIPLIYDTNKKEWVENGLSEPSLIITTETDIEETQTMQLAFIAGVNEDHILEGKYVDDEEERVDKAVEILEGAPIWIEHIPDFSVSDIESIIRRNIRDNDITNCQFDYIHSSMKFMQELSSMSNVSLREDQILFMLSSKLKDMANAFGIFMQSSTQISGAWMEAEEVNQNLLRGAKSIADKVDVGQIGMKIRLIDIPIVDTFEAEGYPRPNYVINMYKIRRGKFAGTKLWCHADLGTCRVEGLFVTDTANNVIPMEGTNIKVVKAKQKARKSILKEEPSAF